MHESLVSRKKAVPSCEQIALEPPLKRVLAKHLHHVSVGRKLGAISIFREIFGHPDFLSGFVYSAQFVRGCLVRTEYPKVIRIFAEHVAKQATQRRRVLHLHSPRLCYLYSIVPKVR